MGSINYYDEKRKNIDNEEILKEYQNELIYNFEYSFIVPAFDEELIQMIKDYNKMEYSRAVFKAINDITERIYEIGGTFLVWV